MNFLTTPGKRLFLTGDEAVARAALEAGVDVVTGYPGNPSTKTVTALLPLASTYGMTVEWSVNEKVALEVAAGAAWAGKRSLVTMKMSGINAMADSLLSLAHSGVLGALVIYAVDDVGTYYGMVEQDSRHYARLASLPLLMPADPEEAYSMTRLAFELSVQTGAPIFLLSTTAVANAITTMKVGELEERPASGPAQFARNPAKFTKATPQWCLQQHADTLARLERAGELCEQAPHLNRVSLPEGGKQRLGVIVAGVSATYLDEVLARTPAQADELAILKLGQVYPLPRQIIRDFLRGLERVLILEELEPLIETEILAELAEMGQHTEVVGKRRHGLPRVGDYTIELVEHALDMLFGKTESRPTPPQDADKRRPYYGTGRVPPSEILAPNEQNFSSNNSFHATTSPDQPASSIVGASPCVRPVRPISQTIRDKPPKLLPLARTLEFCPGCPHRMSYYALNEAIARLGFTQDEVITTGDIGCTIIGMNAPLETCWTEVSMGASIGIAQGLKQAGIAKPVLAAMGDGTFYHNGISGLLNAVQAGVNLTLLILDNSRSAMTGMQPDAGTGRHWDGEPNVRADLALLARGCGVEYVRRLNPYELEETIETLRDAMQYPGVAVVIAEAPCTTPGVLIHEQPVQVDQEACLAGRGCEDTPCYHKVGCPSVLLSLDDVRPRVSIDAATCVSCGLCVAACPFDAIKPVQAKEQKTRISVPLRSLVQD